MLRWLDRFPLVWLVLLALWMLVAPVTPEPHLIEKIRMLIEGQLTRLIDILDLLMHAAPTLLLLVRLVRLKSKAS